MENPKLYKGIEYVQLDELPEEQQLRIKESFNEGLFVKILVNGKLCEDCILYKDYSYWFHSVFIVSNNGHQERAVRITSATPINKNDN
ncbi:MAG TPA: hypothetical protein VFW11_14155 [Cyclobacteriaceae bacterium]|nr:hypothetical protein [Cyclobacteriaceae bacterium]